MRLPTSVYFHGLMLRIDIPSGIRFDIQFILAYDLYDFPFHGEVEKQLLN